MKSKIHPWALPFGSSIVPINRNGLMQPSDEKLMGRYAAGDVSAFRLIYSRYEKKVYGFFLRRLRDPDWAADLFQEAFLRLHQNRQHFDSSRPFAPWFYTIANNLVRDELKRKGGIQFDAIEREENLPDSGLATPDEPVAMSEIKESVESALRMLPEPQREVLLLSRLGGISQEEVGEITGRSRAAVKQLLYRAVKNLRRHLHDL